MNNMFENFIQENIDFIPDYKKITNRINISKYIKKTEFERKKKNFWKSISISLTAILIIIIIPIIIINNLPQHELHPIKDIDKIENTFFDNYLRIELDHIFQDESDVVVLKVETVAWSTKQLKSLHIKGNSLEITEIQAFGELMPSTLIDSEKYYYIDLLSTSKHDYKNFFLFLSFERGSCSKNIFYSDIVNYYIVAQSFNIYLNYGYEESQKQNLRFYYDENDIYGTKVICYNNINDVLQSTSFSALYLPDLNKHFLSEELLYVPEKSLSIRSRNYYPFSVDVAEISFSLGIWVSDTGIMYGNQTKIPYSYHGINFMIIVHEASVTIEYTIDFSVKDKKTNETIQYTYLIKASSVEKVKEFIRSISLHSLS